MTMVGNGSGPAPSSAARLSSIYPVNSFMELTLSNHNNSTSTTTTSTTILRGLIYCTDEISNTIVLKKALVHTTLSSEITLVNATSVVERKIIFDYNTNTHNTSIESGESSKSGNADDSSTIFTEEEARAIAGVQLDELKLPLPHVSAKILEERERRALRLAEESLSHINQGASPTGQKIFDTLLKACNEVVWKGESIVVLKEIRVDPPYTAENCVLIKGGGGGGGGGAGRGGRNDAAGGDGGSASGGLDEHSLERVKKIVLAASTANRQ